MLKKDAIAGFGVFLLALPLCLGIAVASGTPPIAGIFAAILGGILGSLSGSSGLTIKGPAAGMIAIVLGAVQELGQGDAMLGYKLMLAAGVIAALLQILIAQMRKADLVEIIPPFVIQGMLAAIGVIIISKQLYALAGLTPSATSPLMLLYNFPKEINNLHPVAFGIGLLALGIVIIWPKMKTFIPSSIVILTMCIPLSLYFNLSNEAPKLLINLPKNLFAGIQFPDFSQILSPASLKTIIMFALIGSVESLLTVCAVDSLRGDSSNLNKDLRATGIVNLASSTLGGLPVISEIVRSKANIDYGAVSSKANFFHGLFLLLSLLLFPSLINLIPFSALAALLIFVGLRLASPKEFLNAYKVGKDQFAIFFTTFLVTLATDLLVGVAAGICLNLLILLLRGNNLNELFNPSFATDLEGDHVVLRIDGPLTFVSYLKFKKTIDALVKAHKKILISFHAVTYLDHTVIRKIQILSSSYKDIEITIAENQELVPLYNHPLSERLTYDR